MTAMFPGSGVPPADAKNSIADPDTVNCDELWYSTSRCQPRFDPAAANAVLAELINLINKGEVTYDCEFLDQVQLAVRYLIQRGLPCGAPAVGGPNDYLVTLDPPLTRYNDHLTLVLVPSANNAGAVRVNVNGQGWVPVQRSDGSILGSGEWAFDRPLVVSYWQGVFYVVSGSSRAGVRTRLTGNAIFYIATTGSDITGDGTLARPWLTRQHAWYTAQALYDLAYLYTVTFQMLDGTYNDSLTASGMFAGATTTSSIIFNGNVATPSAVVITKGWTGSLGALFRIQGFTSYNPGGSAVLATSYSTISIGNGNVFGASFQAHIHANIGGTITIEGNYTVTGGAQNHYLAGVSSYIFATIPLGVTLTGTPAFSTAFATALEGSNINIPAFSVTYVGGATGQRYAAYSNGVINTTGGGPNYFPGNVAGVTATGGQYF